MFNELEHSYLKRLHIIFDYYPNIVHPFACQTRTWLFWEDSWICQTRTCSL